MKKAFYFYLGSAPLVFVVLGWFIATSSPANSQKCMAALMVFIIPLVIAMGVGIIRSLEMVFSEDVEPPVTINADDRKVIEAMYHRGGSFFSRLGYAGLVADSENLQRLKKAFPEKWAEYAAMERGEG